MKPDKNTKNQNFAIKLENVSKLYFKQNQKTFKEVIPALIKGEKSINRFWALKDINLKVKKGDSLGIIGPNGSGKSTLLKLMAGVTQPTKGKVIVNGKIAPLIELGAGFHPELSGRENVYLNGIILGMTRKKIDEIFDEIVDFADLWEFIDQPVKLYSSGMFLRLAFSVVIHSEPDILLIDEILAVGDSEFQNRCIKKIKKQVKKKNNTLILVSHNLNDIRRICNKAMYLKDGIIHVYGKPEYTIKKYLYANTETNQIKSKKIKKKTLAKQKKVKSHSDQATINKVTILNNEQKNTNQIISGDQFSISLTCQAKKDLKDVIIGIALYQHSTLLYGTNSELLNKKINLRKGNNIIKFTFDNNCLLAGQIDITVAIQDSDFKTISWYDNITFFNIVEINKQNDGLIKLDAKIHEE